MTLAKQKGARGEIMLLKVQAVGYTSGNGRLAIWTNLSLKDNWKTWTKYYKNLFLKKKSV